MNQRLFVQTKRFALNVLRVQRGANLKEILESSITPEQQKLYDLQVEREQQISSERAAKPGLKKSETHEDLSVYVCLCFKKKKIISFCSHDTWGTAG